MKAIRNPWKVQRKVRTMGPSPILSLNNYLFRRKHGNGIDIMEEDWDNLIILDACRYDYFAEQNTIKGNLRRVISQANYSLEFMTENFSGKELHDTVYVTANPFVKKLDDNIFYTVKSVLNKWDENIEAIHPQDVVDAATEAAEQYPNKRLIIHFMQPHQPFLGKTANKIVDEHDILGINRWRVDGYDPRTGISWWDAVRSGKITWDETRQAYRETLNIALDHCENLLSMIDGKSVITADHGELLGERILPFTARRTGHPQDTYTEELCVVPWLEISGEVRRDIISEDPVGEEQIDKKEVDKQLKALGYKPE